MKTLSLGDLEFDAARRIVAKNGSLLKLSPKEFDVLFTLAAHPGRALTHTEILTEVWGADRSEDTRRLRVYIGRLREKIEVHPEDPQLIVTQPGVGYGMIANGRGAFTSSLASRRCRCRSR